MAFMTMEFAATAVVFGFPWSVDASVCSCFFGAVPYFFMWNKTLFIVTFLS